MIYKFNNLTIDTEKFSLSTDNDKTAVEPQVFNLIVLLIENKDKIITRDFILDHVWKGRIVSDTSINNIIKSARKVLGDNGEKQQVIKTIRSRGYQFVANLDESHASITDKSSASTLKDQSEGPLIAVLPLQNLSSDAEQNYFAEGISEDLTTELFKFNNIQVIARHTAFQYNSVSFDASQLRDELGIDYFIEGSIRKTGNKIRINIQLIDTLKNNHVWAEKYDDIYENIYEIIDDIIEQVVSIVSNEIMRIETNRSLGRSSTNLRAYDHFLRGLYFHKSIQNSDAAIHEFNQAVALDPNFARARAWLICSRFSTLANVTDETNKKDLADVKTALEIDQSDSDIHRILGAIYSDMKEFSLAEHHYNEALRISPNDTNIIIKSATFFALMDEDKRAKKLTERAFLLNPRHPSWYWREIGIINYCWENHHLSIESFLKNTSCSANDYAMIAACYSALKDKSNAKKYASMALDTNPQITVAACTQYDTFKNVTRQNQLINRMIAAGMNP